MAILFYLKKQEQLTYLQRVVKTPLNFKQNFSPQYVTIVVIHYSFKLKLGTNERKGVSNVVDLIKSREPEDQSLHDRVIDELAKYYSDEPDVMIHKNSNQKYVWVVDGLYPDVIVYKLKGGFATNTPIKIAEVETNKSVNDYEAKEQWVPYTELNILIFDLVVPKKCTARAMELLRKYHIEEKVKLYYFDFDKNGNFIFHTH